MKIRALIKKLQKFEDKYGNLPVNTVNSMYNPDEENEYYDLLVPIADVGEELDEDDKVVAIMILDLETAESFSA
jgi:hypothetical protein